MSCNHSQKGFTFIELLVVISIIAILSTIGIASFVDYSRVQTMSNAVQDVTTMLQNAKASAESQLKPVDNVCTGAPLTGYKVVITTVARQYYIVPECGGNEDGNVKITKTLPDTISFSSGSGYILFNTITGNVTSSFSFPISISFVSTSSYTKTIIVDKEGRISVQ